MEWILYLSLVNNKWKGGICSIFTGINYNLSVRIVGRCADLIHPFFPYAKETEYPVRVNGVEITAFPVGHTDTTRSLTNCRKFFLDEFDFFEVERNKERS
ncbi:MAG: hypothetical protein WBL44_18060 [Nitrososphaeraceae archaeon]|jgi:hypothetical protein